jgi:hypothetical protein
MSQLTLTLAPTGPQTRVLLTPRSKGLLPAIRLLLSHVRHQQTPATCFRALSHELNHKLPVVWSVDEPVGSLCCGRSNDLGDGTGGNFFDVTPVDHLELSPASDQ